MNKTYYWLGKTANGDVNEKENWTTYKSWASNIVWPDTPNVWRGCGFPPSASSPPGFGDEVIFGAMYIADCLNSGFPYTDIVDINPFPPNFLTSEQWCIQNNISTCESLTDPGGNSDEYLNWGENQFKNYGTQTEEPCWLPIYPPRGTLQGGTGPIHAPGLSGIPYLRFVKVEPEFPLSMGISGDPFCVRTSTYQDSRGHGDSRLSPDEPVADINECSWNTLNCAATPGPDGQVIPCIFWTPYWQYDGITYLNPVSYTKPKGYYTFIYLDRDPYTGLPTTEGQTTRVWYQSLHDQSYAARSTNHNYWSNALGPSYFFTPKMAFCPTQPEHLRGYSIKSQPNYVKFLPGITFDSTGFTSTDLSVRIAAKRMRSDCSVMISCFGATYYIEGHIGSLYSRSNLFFNGGLDLKFDYESKSSNTIYLKGVTVSAKEYFVATETNSPFYNVTFTEVSGDKKIAITDNSWIFWYNWPTQLGENDPEKVKIVNWNTLSDSQKNRHVRDRIFIDKNTKFPNGGNLMFFGRGTKVYIEQGASFGTAHLNLFSDVGEPYVTNHPLYNTLLDLPGYRCNFHFYPRTILQREYGPEVTILPYDTTATSTPIMVLPKVTIATTLSDVLPGNTFGDVGGSRNIRSTLHPSEWRPSLTIPDTNMVINDLQMDGGRVTVEESGLLLPNYSNISRIKKGKGNSWVDCIYEKDFTTLNLEQVRKRNLVLQYFGTNGPTGDLNNDGIVNNLDLAEALSNFETNQTYTPSIIIGGTGSEDGFNLNQFTNSLPFDGITQFSPTNPPLPKIYLREFELKTNINIDNLE